MNNVRACLTFVLLLTTQICFSNDKQEQPANRLEDWLPVTAQDLELKEVPKNPGAPAIQLYYSYYKDDDAHFEFEYRRIKILREAGKKYADVEIPVDPWTTLLELKARTIRPDGTSIDLKDKPFEKIIRKERGIKFLARTFTFPEATVGSIIEYRYKLDLPRFFFLTISKWELQYELFTLKARFRYRAFQGAVFVPAKWSTTGKTAHSQVSSSYINQLDTRVPEKKQGNLMELELENIRAFNSEEYMPPVYDYKPLVMFYYGGREVGSPDKFWEALGKYWADNAEKFIGNSQEIRALALQVIGSDTAPESQLRKLFSRAQQVRNLSYERKRSKVEEKKEELKENRNALDVLNHGFGTADDIDLFFAALVRAAGFEVYVLQVSDRRHLSFNKIVLFPGQLDSKVVMVRAEGKNLFLDPGTEGCPYGMVHWKHTAVSALKLGKAGAEFVTTPAPDLSVMHRIAKVALTPDGSLHGELTVEIRGQDALEHRLDALKTDDTGRRQALEDEVRSWLPQDAIVKLQDATGWDRPEDPILLTLTLDIPHFAAITGKRLVAPSFFLPTFRREIFTADSRIYPIEFPYPFTESDEITMKLPRGYSLEAPPYRRKAGFVSGGYEISSTLQDDQLITKRILHVDGLLFAPEEYDQLKNFFSVVHAGDGGQAVFKPQQTTSADKKD